MKSIIIICIVLFCLACHGNKLITNSYQQVIVTKVCKIGEKYNTIKIRELNDRTQYFMRTVLTTRKGDTILAIPGVDYYYSKWY